SALEVRVDHVIPIRLGVLQHRFGNDDAGIVYQDAQRSEFLFGSRDCSSDIVRAGDVAGNRQAFAASCLDLTGQFGKPVDPPRGQSYLRSRSSEKRGEVTANAARRAGHERHLARNAEARQFGHEAISLVRSRNSNFWTLPVEVLGNGPNTIVRGTL